MFNFLEWVLVLLISPILLFPTFAPKITVIVLGLLFLLWAGRFVLYREAWPITPFNITILTLGISLLVSGLVTYYPELTIRKIANLILGLSVFRVTTLIGKEDKGLKISLISFFIIGAGFLIIGALAVHWPTQKVPWFSSIVKSLPRYNYKLPELSTNFVNPNQLAAVGLLTFPMTFSLLREKEPLLCIRRLCLYYISLVLVVLGICEIIVIFLTQSRGGWIGLLVGIWTLLFLWRRSSHRAYVRLAPVVFLLLVVVVFVVGTAIIGVQEIHRLLSLHETRGKIVYFLGRTNMAWRWEVWLQSLKLIRYAPWTGIGLGTYREVAQRIFPSAYLSAYHDIIYDSHQTFLQVAVDLGVVGLISYLAIIGVALKLGFRLSASADKAVRAVAIGSTSSLIALHFYGLLNAMAPGSKPGLLFWFLLGFLAASAHAERHLQ